MKPYDFLLKWYRLKVERDQKNAEFIHAQSDGLISWLIGFSVTGLLLIAGNLDKLAFRSPTKIILIFLFLTIVVGLIFRYVSYLITMFQKSVTEYFTTALAEDEPMPIDEYERLDAMSFDELKVALEVDFDEKLSYPHPISDEIKERDAPSLRNHYRLLLEYSRKDFELGIDYIAGLDEAAYKIPKQKTLDAIKSGIKAGTNKMGYNLKAWSQFRGTLYILCILTFLSAVTILFISLLRYMN